MGEESFLEMILKKASICSYIKWLLLLPYHWAVPLKEVSQSESLWCTKHESYQITHGLQTPHFKHELQFFSCPGNLFRKWGNSFKELKAESGWFWISGGFCCPWQFWMCASPHLIHWNYSKLSKKRLVVALPLGAESCFHINSLIFRRVDC